MVLYFEEDLFSVEYRNLKMELLHVHEQKMKKSITIDSITHSEAVHVTLGVFKPAGLYLQ